MISTWDSASPAQRTRSTMRQITAFAREFDPQPFHLDREAAKHSVFHGLVASGWHVAAITMRLLVTSGLPITGGLVGLGGELAWPNATRPGDVLHVESEILEIVPSRSGKDRGVVMVRSETRNQRGDVVQRTTVKLLVPRRVHDAGRLPPHPGGDPRTEPPRIRPSRQPD
jgi:acyl dehydratase